MSRLIAKGLIVLSFMVVGGAATVSVVLPDQASDDAKDQVSQQSEHLPPEAEEGQETAEAKKAAAEKFATDIQAWAMCVAEAAADQGDEAEREEGEFDPTAACSPRPDPQDEEYEGLTDPPSQADDSANGGPPGDVPPTSAPDPVPPTGVPTP